MKLKESWKKWVLGSIGAVVAGAAIMLGGVMVGYPAISSLVGLAVAQTATLWNNVKDAAVGDGLTNGILVQSMYLFNGSTFDRARGDTTNGLDVDVTRMPGSTQTPADDFANPTTFQGTWSLGAILNGTTWDRWRGEVSPVQGDAKVNATVVSGSNAVLTLTLTGVSGKKVHLYRLNHVACSPEGSSKIQITDGGTLVYDSYVGSVPAAPMSYSEVWPVGLTGTAAASMVITVNACGAGNVSLLSYESDNF